MVSVHAPWICDSCKAVCSWQNGAKALSSLLAKEGEIWLPPPPCPQQAGAHLLPLLIFLGHLFGQTGVAGPLESQHSDRNGFLLG